MYIMYLPSILTTAFLLATSHCHPGHDTTEEIAARREFLSNNRNNLNHCSEKHKAGGVTRRSIERRAELAVKLSRSSHLQARQLRSIDKSHKSTKPFNASTDSSEIFTSINSCVLQPEVTEGPFYVLGESVRSKVDDGEPGISLHLDVQMIDVNTCEPVKGAFLEIWSCNSTGVYSGANAVPNGSGLGDLSNLNNSFLRGIQMSNDDGVVQFESVFPGHYATRAVHIHFMAHLNATAHPNGTVWNTKATHVGQGFFDHDLIKLVKATPPYSTNQQEFTNNADDAILRQEAATTDPFFEYVLLGDGVQDGVLAWLQFGINTTFSRTVQVAAMKNKEGGQMNTNNPGGFLSGWFPGGFPTSFYATPSGVPFSLPSGATGTPVAQPPPPVSPTTPPKPSDE